MITPTEAIPIPGRAKIALAITGVFVVASRLIYYYPYLYSWDSVQFALSLERFDIQKHQPHPPGYILYWALLKFLNLFFGDPNRAGVFLNILCTVLATGFVFLLALELLSGDEEQRPWVPAVAAAAIYATNPICWFYGCVLEIYPVEGFFVALIAWMCLVCLRDRRYLIPLAIAMGIAGGIRPTTELFVLPLYAMTLYRAGKGRIVVSLVVLVVVNLCWLIPLFSLAGGVGAYVKSLANQFVAAKRTEGENPVRIPTLLISLVQSATLPLFASILFRIYRMKLSRKDINLLAMFFPAMLFFAFVHYTLVGYFMVLVPLVVCLSIAWFWKLYADPVMRGVAILLAILINVYVFAKPPIYTAPELENEPVKQFVTDITSPNRFMLKSYATSLKNVLADFRALPGRRMIVVERAYFPDWRILMYYLPDDDVLLIMPSRRVRWARNHDYTEKEVATIAPDVGTLLLVSNSDPQIPFHILYISRYRYYQKSPAELPNHFQVFGARFRKEG